MSKVTAINVIINERNKLNEMNQVYLTVNETLEWLDEIQNELEKKE